MLARLLFLTHFKMSVIINYTSVNEMMNETVGILANPTASPRNIPHLFPVVKISLLKIKNNTGNSY